MGAEIFWLVSGFPGIAAEPVKRIPSNDERPFGKDAGESVFAYALRLRQHGDER
jgi:hypothetical protein